MKHVLTVLAVLVLTAGAIAQTKDPVAELAKQTAKALDEQTSWNMDHDKDISQIQARLLTPSRRTLANEAKIKALSAAIDSLRHADQDTYLAFVADLTVARLIMESGKASDPTVSRMAARDARTHNSQNFVLATWDSARQVAEQNIATTNANFSAMVGDSTAPPTTGTTAPPVLENRVIFRITMKQ